MPIIRGTTPTFILKIPDHDITGASVYVTLQQGNKLVTKTGDDLGMSSDGTDTYIAVLLSQKETLSFNKGKGEIQVRFIDANRTAFATKIKDFSVDRVLLQKVIEYGGEQA